MKKVFEDQIRHLERRHQRLEAQLGQLMRQARLTPQEYQHCRELKKRKLQAKDGLFALRQQAASS